MQPSRSNRVATAVFWSIFISFALILGVVGIFGRFERWTRESDAAGSMSALLLVILVILVTVVAGVVLAVLLSQRTRLIRRRTAQLALDNPRAIVFELWIPRPPMRTDHLRGDYPRLTDVLDEVSVVADDEGLYFWQGVGQPRLVRELPWGTIESFQAVGGNSDYLSNRPELQIGLTAGGVYQGAVKEGARRIAQEPRIRELARELEEARQKAVKPPSSSG